MHTQLEKYLVQFSQSVFNSLKSDEVVSLNIHSEESDFVRFNHSKVRQNTSVHQHEATLVYQNQHKQYKAGFNLSLDLEYDIQIALHKISEIRQQLPFTDASPKFSPIENHGTSSVYKKSKRESTEQILKHIQSEFAGCDMVGLFCSGPLRQASINSLGQFHFFENDNFFLDFSIYNGARAAKGFYSESEWSHENFSIEAKNTKTTLALLSRKQVQVKPAAHRSYLSPMAVAELATMFYWGSLSRNRFEQGIAPLKKLANKEVLFSEKFSLIENNRLGFDSHFNTTGEIVPEQITLIENGELKNFLISTSTAKEYNLVSNQADPSEMLRSPEIRAGTLLESDILKILNTGLYLSNLHYINWSDIQAARITGMTRFACFWVENAEIVGPIQDLRFDDTLYNIFGKNLVDLTEKQSVFSSTSTYERRSKGGMKVPGMLLNEFNFTL